MILVTGSTGLVGSHLLFHLASNGIRVRALIRSRAGIAAIQKLFHYYSANAMQLLTYIEWAEGDVTDYQTIREHMVDVKQVYHCAALVGMGGIPAEKMLETNVGGTANVVDAMLDSGVKRLCHVSSIAALGQGTNGQVNESTEWGKGKGKSIYAISKFRSEMEVWRGAEQGLSAVVVNPSVIIGPCDWRKGTGKIFGALSRGLPFYTLGVSGYVDVRDVVQGMVTATSLGMWGKRYIISSGNFSHKEIFTCIATGLGKRAPFITISPWAMAMALPFAWLGGVLTRSEPILTRETIKSGSTRTYYSAQLAQQELGITFRPIQDAIANTIAAGNLG